MTERMMKFLYVPAMDEEQEGIVMCDQKNEAFSCGVVFHKIVGFWPEDDQPLGRFCRAKTYGLAALAIGVSCFEFTALIGETDIINILEIVIEIMSSLTVVAKIMLFVFNRNSILQILYMTQKLNISVDVTAREREISIRWQQIQTQIIKACIGSYVATLFLFICLPMLKNKGLPFQGILPNVLYESPWYEMVYAFQIVLMFFRFVGVMSSDILSITFMCQLCREFDALQCSIRNLEKSRKQSFSRIIARHAIALDYGGIICNNFSAIFLIQHTCIGIILGLVGIAALNAKNSFIFLKLSLMGVVAVISMLLICYVGEKVTSASLEIANAVESNAIQTFLGDTFSIKLVHFTLFRAQQPLRLAVGNQGTMNLRFFSQTMNKVFSLFMLVKAAME